METFPALLVICAGNSPVNGEFPSQRPVKRSFDVFFDLRLNWRLRKQWWGWWFETLSRPLWRHCNVLSSYPERLCRVFKFETKMAVASHVRNLHFFKFWTKTPGASLVDVDFIFAVIFNFYRHLDGTFTLFGGKLDGSGLTHLNRVTHICVSKLTIIGSDNGLSPGRRQAIIWTNVGILFLHQLGP